jgi:two-component system KDP operon response regulator KdpE
MTRVLLIDDEPQISRVLVIHLQVRKYEVDTAQNAAEGLLLAAERRPDVVVLDLDLPGTDGARTLRALRELTPAPIIALSARRTPDDRAAALAAGADDHLPKPFDVDGLLARLRTAVRRAGHTGGGPADVLVETPAFTVDLAARKVTRGGKDVRLTPTEWHLLEVLVRNTGRPVDKRRLLREVWGPSYGTETNYLRVYMAQLRRKLERDPAHPQHLLTEPGTGYRFEK